MVLGLDYLYSCTTVVHIRNTQRWCGGGGSERGRITCAAPRSDVGRLPVSRAPRRWLW